LETATQNLKTANEQLEITTKRLNKKVEERTLELKQKKNSLLRGNKQFNLNSPFKELQATQLIQTEKMSFSKLLVYSQ